MSQSTQNLKQLQKTRFDTNRAVLQANDMAMNLKAEIAVRRCELAVELNDERIKELHYIIDDLENQLSKKPRK
jgi:hypothetical protein